MLRFLAFLDCCPTCLCHPIDVAVVPEPHALILMGTVLIVFLIVIGLRSKKP